MLTNLYFRLILTLLAFGVVASFIFFTQTRAGTTQSVSITPAGTLQTGLVGYWTFDGAKLSQNAVDDSGQGNTGYLTNFTSTTTIPGRLGQALKFDGVNDYVDLITGSSLQITGAITVSAWVKTSSTATMSIFGNRTAGARGYNFGMNNVAGKLRFTYFNVVDWDCNAGSAKSDGLWHHYVIVNPTSGTLSCYVDGVAAGNPASAAGTTQGPNDLNLGVFSDGGTLSSYLNGSLDDVRVYNRALTPAEVTQLYNLGATTKIATSINPGSLQTGLVGHWTFDGKDLQQNATDSSGQGNTGYLTSFTSTTTVPGRLGQALSFDGVNDCIDIGSTLGNPSNITISAWAKWSSLADTSAEFGGIVSRANGNDAFNILFEESTNKLRFYVRKSAGWSFTEWGTTPTVGVWYHVMLRHSGDTIEGFINGVSIGSATSVSAITNVSSNYQIGGYTTCSSVSATRAFDGSLDDVRIYNRALTPEEITQLYNLGATTKIATSINPAGSLQTGLVGWWTFDGKDTTNTTALDLSGQANTGTLTSFTRFNGAVAGKLGQALSFDGVNDYISITNGNSFGFAATTTFTVTAWFKKTATAGRVIFANGTATCTTGGFLFYASTVVGAQFLSSGSCGNSFASSLGTTAVADGKWHFAAMTGVTANTPSANEVTVYTDGVKATTGTGSGSAGYVAATSPGIGTNPNGSTYFLGSIDDVRVYNRALTPAEILQLYNLGK